MTEKEKLEEELAKKLKETKKRFEEIIKQKEQEKENQANDKSITRK